MKNALGRPKLQKIDHVNYILSCHSNNKDKNCEHNKNKKIWIMKIYISGKHLYKQKQRETTRIKLCTCDDDDIGVMMMILE